MRSLLNLLGLVVLCALVPAYGQGLTLRPAVVPLSGELGQGVTQSLTLQNDSDQPLEFELEAQDVVVKGGKRLFVEAGRLAGSIAASAVFNPRRVRVEPRSMATATVTLTLPRTTRYRAVVALFKGTTLVQAGNRKATMSLGTLFTFTVSNGTSLAAGKLEVTPPSGSTNTQFRSTVINDGTEPVVPSGMAVLLDAQGRMVGKTPFGQRRLLPGETATLMAEYPGELARGSYRAVATFDVAGRPLTLVSPLNVP